MSEFIKANYHTHTYRCQHASGTERQYVEAAIDMGIKKLGFSDHIPCPFPNGYVSNIRMTMDQAEEYRQVIAGLAREYKEQIAIYAGFEAEYIPAYYDRQMQMFHDLEFDYMIMGQHFWVSEEKGTYSGSPTTDESKIRSYVDSVIEGMKTGSYAYLAHPDLINFQGMDSVYEWEMLRLCKAMKELDIPLEINLLGMEGNRHYPAERFWKLVSEVGNDVIIGLDAHMVETIKDKACYEKCLELAQKYQLNLLSDLKIFA